MRFQVKRIKIVVNREKMLHNCYSTSWSSTTFNLCQNIVTRFFLPSVMDKRIGTNTLVNNGFKTFNKLLCYRNNKIRVTNLRHQLLLLKIYLKYFNKMGYETCEYSLNKYLNNYWALIIHRQLWNWNENA